MSEQTQHSADCARLERLVLAEAEGAETALSHADRAFRDAHVADCAACRAELALHAELRFDGTAPAASAVDDLNRRRRLRDIVAAAAVGQSATAITGPTEHRRAWMFAAIALAACLAVGLGFAFWPRGPRSAAPRKPAGLAASEGRVLLHSGQAFLDDAPLRLQQPLRAGQRLRTRSGRAAVRLPMGSTVLLSAQTRLGLDVLKQQNVVLRLDRGELLASVTRRRPGRRFRVITPSGSISVKGTAFSLYVTASYTALRVLHGVVVVTEPGRAAREVRPGTLVVLGRKVAASLSPRMAAAGQRMAARALWLLPRAETTNPSALTVHTTPSGAAVLVDGTPLGFTPLAVALEPGRRQVVVRRAGHDTVQESVDLAPGESVTRSFALKPSKIAASLSPPPETPAPTSAPTPPSGVRSTPTPALAPAPTSSPAPPAVTARELLERAQKRRAARDWAGATKAYQELIRRFPASTEGRAALVSVGIILLGPLGNASAALGYFDRYLAVTRSGDLAQEAGYGRARAFRKLGRRAAEITALRDFLRRYPQALQVPSARSRLGALTAPPIK
ncbi:MAG: FecR domain-containing protein [bacterium]